MEKTMEGIVLDCKVDGKMIHFSFPDRTAFYEAVEEGKVPEKVTSASVFGQKLPEIVGYACYGVPDASAPE